MKPYLEPLTWAAAMLALALLARLGLADRHAVMTLLIVLPALAFVSLRQRRCGAATA